MTLAFRHTPKKGTGLRDWIMIKAVQWWTNSKYYHVELIANEKWISAHLENGIQMNELRTLSSDWDYIEVSDKRLANKNMRWIESQIGVEYDWLGILGLVVFKNKLGILHSTNKWFCSEIVTKILQTANDNRVTGLAASTVTPADLFEIYNKG